MNRSENSLAIAIVSASLSRSGGGMLPIMQNHALELRRSGFNVTAHGILDRFTREDEDGWGGTPLYPVRPKLEHFAFAPELTRNIKNCQPNIVHQHGLWQYPSIAVASWRSENRGKVVISTQGMLEPWALSNSRIKKKLAAAAFERANLKAAAVIHCSSAELLGVRNFGLRNPVALIPNGAVLPETGKVPRPDIDPYIGGFRVMLFLGRLHPKKGIAQCLKAWAFAKTRMPDLMQTWKFVIAGWDDGNHEEALQALVKELGLQDDVFFAGPVFGNRKAALLEHSDGFILPSFSEGFPIAILEAWTYALPVFMTRYCNIPSSFRACAAIEIDTDPEQMGRKLIEHLADPNLAEVGERGRELVREQFHWSSIVSNLTEVYRWISGISDQPGCIDLT